MYHALYQANNADFELYFEEDEVLSEIFALIKSKTGLCFDEYADWRFYPDHQKILVRLLREKEAHKEIIDFFETSIRHDKMVYFIGQ